MGGFFLSSYDSLLPHREEADDIIQTQKVQRQRRVNVGISVSGTKTVSGNVLAPVRFLTPFPHILLVGLRTPPIQSKCTSEIPVNSATYALVPIVLKHLRPADSVSSPRRRLGKAKSSDVASSIPRNCQGQAFESIAHRAIKEEHILL